MSLDVMNLQDLKKNYWIKNKKFFALKKLIPTYESVYKC